MTDNNPIFRAIFGPAWDRLPIVLQMHYANRPHSHDRVVVQGVMEVTLSPLIRLLSPLLRHTKTLVPIAAKDVPVTVTFSSNPDNDHFAFDRVFHLPGQQPYQFKSVMVPVGGNQMVEYTGTGIGWRCRYTFDAGIIYLTHVGYQYKIGRRSVALPLDWLIGKGFAEEYAIDEKRFAMRMELRHWLLGKVYGYSGYFDISEVAFHD